LAKNETKDFKRYIFAGAKFEFEEDEGDGEGYGDEGYDSEDDWDYRRNLKVQDLNSKYRRVAK
jgi:hypothetical protein